MFSRKEVFAACAGRFLRVRWSCSSEIAVHVNGIFSDITPSERYSQGRVCYVADIVEPRQRPCLSRVLSCVQERFSASTVDCRPEVIVGELQGFRPDLPA